MKQVKIAFVIFFNMRCMYYMYTYIHIYIYTYMYVHTNTHARARYEYVCTIRNYIIFMYTVYIYAYIQNYKVVYNIIIMT